MFISMLTVPIYVAAMFAAVRRRRSAFVVTPKGDAASRDNLGTFRRHLQWAAAILVGFVAAALRGNDNPWMCVWSVLALLVCIAPVAIWQAQRMRLGVIYPLRRARPATTRPGRAIGSAEAHAYAGNTEAA
jgi:hypothetical protein